jgi:hypothetical protein
MDRNQAIALVRETFTGQFEESRFRHFVRNLVNHLDETTHLHFSGNLIERAFAEQVGHYSRIGTYIDPRGERIARDLDVGSGVSFEFRHTISEVIASLQSLVCGSAVK